MLTKQDIWDSSAEGPPSAGAEYGAVAPQEEDLHQQWSAAVRSLEALIAAATPAASPAAGYEIEYGYEYDDNPGGRRLAGIDSSMHHLHFGTHQVSTLYIKLCRSRLILRNQRGCGHAAEHRNSKSHEGHLEGAFTPASCIGFRVAQPKACHDGCCVQGNATHAKMPAYQSLESFLDRMEAATEQLEVLSAAGQGGFKLQGRRLQSSKRRRRQQQNAKQAPSPRTDPLLALHSQLESLIGQAPGPGMSLFPQSILQHESLQSPIKERALGTLAS